VFFYLWVSIFICGWYVCVGWYVCDGCLTNVWSEKLAIGKAYPGCCCCCWPVPYVTWYDGDWSWAGGAGDVSIWSQIFDSWFQYKPDAHGWT